MLRAKRKGLRSGYTTGACAAAAAKAAAELVMSNANLNLQPSAFVEIPFPDGSRVAFKIHNSGMAEGAAWASVIKDAGDDPDVTNGAEIRAEVTLKNSNELRVTGNKKDGDKVKRQDPLLVIKGGAGVGVVTKPGLPVPVGEPAINPVPRRMITEAVMEAYHRSGDSAFSLQPSALEITISVPDGEILAKRTLNPRLGIAGGISILGTSGIVRPISSEAWTATITASMDVARAMGRDTAVLSAGRVSELAHMKKYRLPEETYVMMGDYLEFSFLEAGRHEFREIHLCAQWAKMLKIAMATPQTHVRHGAIDIKKAVDTLRGLGYSPPDAAYEFNTAREIFDLITSSLNPRPSTFFSKVCAAAGKYAEGIVPGIPVTAHLVSYEGAIIASSR